MRTLTSRQIKIRLALFGCLAFLFTLAIIAAEFVLPVNEGITFWIAAALVLGVAGVWGVVRWSQESPDEQQAEWQPALFMRVLTGGLSYQAGVLGYFIGGDLAAALVGFVLFLTVLVLGWIGVGALPFDRA